MKNLIYIIVCILLLSCSKNEDDWKNLLDKDLSEWNNYLSYQHTLDYNGEQPKDKKGKLKQPIGVNKDSFEVFSVIEEKGEQILKVSGEIYGCISTKTEFENYHFRLKVKWGDNVYPPRLKKLKDSGILYHSIGPNGAEFWRSWMLSQEFQIMEGHFGDFWAQANSAIDIRAYPPESAMSASADTSQPFIPFGKGEDLFGYCMRSANYESPMGEWTDLELICFENKSLHIVNENIVMVLKNSRYVKEGIKVPMSKGKIQIQSEAAEVYFKNIEIKKIEALPMKYAQYYKD